MGLIHVTARTSRFRVCGNVRSTKSIRRQSSLELVNVDLAVSVGIKCLESPVDAFPSNRLLVIDSCREEFMEVDLTIAIEVTFLEDVFPLAKVESFKFC